MRRIEPLKFSKIKPADLTAIETPMFDWLAPGDLLIDPQYQRDLSPASLRLIRHIIEHWDWLKFKPPIVALTDRGFEVVDGQHSCIAAVSHGGIATIPVIVISDSALADRAKAFVSHARNRVFVSPGQIFHAEVAAGDEDALTVEAVCKRAGVRILPFSPHYGSGFKVGDTTALASIKALVGRRGAMRSREILEALRAADLAPISADHIRSGEVLCCEQEYAAEFGPEQLTNVLRALGPGALAEVKGIAAAKALPMWRAWVAVLFKHRKAKPKGAVAPEPVPETPAANTPASPPRRIIDHRSVGPVSFGDPTEGRSALDQRTAAARDAGKATVAR